MSLFRSNKQIAADKKQKEEEEKAAAAAPAFDMESVVEELESDVEELESDAEELDVVTEEKPFMTEEEWAAMKASDGEFEAREGLRGKINPETVGSETVNPETIELETGVSVKPFENFKPAEVGKKIQESAQKVVKKTVKETVQAVVQRKKPGPDDAPILEDYPDMSRATIAKPNLIHKFTCSVCKERVKVYNRINPTRCEPCEEKYQKARGVNN